MKTSQFTEEHAEPDIIGQLPLGVRPGAGVRRLDESGVCELGEADLLGVLVAADLDLAVADLQEQTGLHRCEATDRKVPTPHRAKLLLAGHGDPSSDAHVVTEAVDAQSDWLKATVEFIEGPVDPVQVPGQGRSDAFHGHEHTDVSEDRPQEFDVRREAVICDRGRGDADDFVEAEAENVGELGDLTEGEVGVDATGFDAAQDGGADAPPGGDLPFGESELEASRADPLVSFSAISSTVGTSAGAHASCGNSWGRSHVRSECTLNAGLPDVSAHQ